MQKLKRAAKNSHKLNLKFKFFRAIFLRRSNFNTLITAYIIWNYSFNYLKFYILFEYDALKFNKKKKQSNKNLETFSFKCLKKIFISFLLKINHG